MTNAPFISLSPITRTVNRNLLKYAAGYQIFCPCCDRILDCKTTVLVSIAAITKTVCAACWDTAVKPAIESKPGNLLERCEVLDGRVLWSRA